MSGMSAGKRTVLFLTAEKIFQIGSIAIVNIILLRSLGPENFGYLGSATAILAIALPLASFGQISITRHMAAGRMDRTRLAKFAFVLSSCTAALSAIGIVALAFSPLFQVEPTHHLLLILSLAALSRPLSAVDAFFQATGQNGTAASARLLALLIPTALRITIAFTSQSLDQLAWVIVLENVTAGLLLAIAFAVNKERRRRTDEVALPIPYREIVAQSVPLLVAGLAVILYMRVSQPLLLVLANSAEVAYFSAATNLSDALSFIPTILLSALLPALVILHGKSVNEFQTRMRSIFEFTAGMGTLFAIGGVILGPFVVDLLYGPEYSESGVVVQILFLACPFIFIGILRNIWVITQGLQRETLVGSAVAVSVNVAANFALIPQFGAVGAAIAALLAHVINGFLAFALFRKTRPIFLDAFSSLLPWRSLPTLFRSIKARRIV